MEIATVIAVQDIATVMQMTLLGLKLAETAGTYSTHGNITVPHNFIVCTCERRWMSVEPAVFLSHLE